MSCFPYPLLLATLGEGLNDGSSTTVIGYTDFELFLDFTDLKRFHWFQKISLISKHFNRACYNNAT